MALLLLTLAACGKRGNPQPPLTFNPAPSQDLRVQQLGTEVLLRLSYPTTTTSGLTLSGIDGLEVWRMEMPLALGGLPATTYGIDPDALADPDDPEAESDADEGEDPSQATDPESEEAAPDTPTEADDPGDRPDENEPEPSTQQAEEADPEAIEGGEGAEETAPDFELPEIQPPVFQELAIFFAEVGSSELLTATSGDQIAIRLPLPPPSDENPLLYAFAIRTIAASGLTSPWSNIAAIAPVLAPEPPTSIAAEPLKDGIDVGWSSTGEDIAGFSVYRRQADVRIYGEPISRVAADQRSFFDDTPLYEISYIYAVRATLAEDEEVESGLTGEVEVDYRDLFAPEVPTNTEALPESGRIRLLWDGSSDRDVAGYLVYRQDPDQEYRLVTDEPVRRQEYVDEGLTVGLSYRYRVTAIDDNGNESEPGDETVVEPR